jgi:hypothetical protein
MVHVCSFIKHINNLLQSIHRLHVSDHHVSTEQQPNASDNFLSTEIKPYLDNRSGNVAAGKQSTKVTK